MARGALTVSPGALFVAAFLYFLGGGAALAAFYTASLAHELGHLAVMAALGARIGRIRLEAAGAVIDYVGAFSPGGEAAVIAAGPLSGLLLAAACAAADTPYFRFVGMAALLSSAYNLLPVYPLDGGRLAGLLLKSAFSQRTEAVLLRVLGLLGALGVTAAGLCVRAPAAAAAGIWLAVLAIGSDLR